MPESATATFDQLLPSAAFERLKAALLAVADALEDDQILVDTDLTSSPDTAEQFAVVISQEFNVLLRGVCVNGGAACQVKLTFDSTVIAEFLAGVQSQAPKHLRLPQTIAQLLAQDQGGEHPAPLQRALTLQLLSAMVEDRPTGRAWASPTGIAVDQTTATVNPTAAACQPMVDAALHQQIAQERLLNQVTTQIRQSLDLSDILETAVTQVRAFLHCDRLVIYQFTEAAALDSKTSHPSVPPSTLEGNQGCVIYEARDSETIPSALTYQERFCWEATHICRLKYSQGLTLAVDDIEHNYTASDCLRDFLRTLNVRAKLVTPILVQSRLWGFLIAHQCQPRSWQDHEQQLLRQIGEHLAIAIYQAQLYQELQHQKQTLEHQVSQRTQELHEALLATQAANRIKHDFLATMSHELRTPLTCVIGMSATLLRWSLGPLTDKQRGYLQTIHKSGEHLLELINDILDLSLVESGKATLNLQPCSLASLAQQSVQLLRDKARAQEVALKLKLNIPKERDQFVADPQRVKQILFNLLDNAIKFTPAEGTVILRVWVDTNTAVFQVEDTGIGIATSEQSRLFQKFQQLDQSYRRNYEGAGLGLALAKEFVDLHRGWIEVSSVEGQGSVFTVELPHPASTAEPSLPDLEDQPSSGSRVVLIDAQEDSATLICDMLTAAGYQVIWMVEASTAMDQILFLQPVVVIADLQLFGRDARRAVFDHRCQWIQRLRQRPETQNIKICALLPKATLNQSHPDWVPGADAYLVRPIDPEYLLYKMELLLARERGRGHNRE